jgi:hypothetical protein
MLEAIHDLEARFDDRHLEFTSNANSELVPGMGAAPQQVAPSSITSSTWCAARRPFAQARGHHLFQFHYGA